MKTEVTPTWGGASLGTKAIEHEGFTPADFESLSAEEKQAACRLLDKQTFISFGSRYARAWLAKGFEPKRDNEKQPEYESRTHQLAKEDWPSVEYPKSSVELFRWGYTTMRRESDGNAKVKAATEAAVAAVVEAMAAALKISVEEAKAMIEATKKA